MGGDAEDRTPAQRRTTGTRRAVGDRVADRVEALTQPVPGHELADVRFERRTVIGPRSAWILTVTVALLVVVVGGVMLFSDSGDTSGDVVAGLSPGTTVASEVSGTAGVETAGDTGGDADGADREPEDGEGPAVVSVQGMVHRPGLLTVSDDARVGEVIDRSGGVRADGRVEGINLAEPVVDGMQIVVDAEGSRVLYPGETPDGPARPSADAGDRGGPDAGGDRGDGASGAVNINTADMTELTSLSGVGPATAEAIITWRDNNGQFSAVEQLMEVKGIGPAKFEALRDSVTV